MESINKKYTLICLLVLSSLNILAQGYKLPNYTTFKLANGLTFNLMEQHDVPIVDVAIIFPAGAIYDQDKAGLASLTATALKHGTQRFTSAKLEEELDFMGATVNTYATKEFAGLSSNFASKDKDQVLLMIKEIVQNPVFDAAEFEKEKSRRLVRLDQQKESPGAVIGSYFDSLLYGNHVYGNNITGTKTTVELLTVADVNTFYKNNYKPDTSVISVVGDFKSIEMKKTLTQLFSNWKSNATPQENLASKAIVLPTENKVLLVNKDDAKETTMYIGAAGVSRNNPDYVAIDVVNTLFGGRFTSMLNDELRVNSGLTYGASSRFSALKNGGSFIMSTFTAVNTTEPTIDKALEVLKKLHTKGLDEKALASAKNYVKGQFPPDYETAGQLARLLSTMYWYDLDRSFIDNFEKNVDRLDLAKANEIIAKYFPEDKLQFVLVGKASEIKKIVEKYGPVTQVEIAQ
ncbi:M16 family metallopeptidase [Flavobacterium muglaense]|uniref:Insulinase family protein n=1 Tax=Flavobacterium muglaense TaxID=2764716 RepID=A0A923SGV1_9FLAO|nr:pitrilysin family protein [Flavobacterium muglaense]MBC5839596.1 insulinase family protein [Flavobacterium muglaense]MBC5846132.1 insulinase family protein [Flavobacterium muglaense]